MEKAVDGIRFYESFFKRETFLSPGRTDVYSGIPYLHGMGLDDKDIYEGRKVLEIGAGCGRITSLLNEYGMLKITEQYTVVEPTSAIHRISEIITSGQATFLQSSLENLNKILPPESFDTVLCMGVVPHLGESLHRSLESAAYFLRPGGVLMINAFFNGDRLRLSQALRCHVVGHPALTRTLAILQTALQKLAYTLPSGGLKAFYHRHFPYSFQKSIRGIFDQSHEYFSVPHYNIAWSYQDYLVAMAATGLGLVELYPTSLSLRAVKGPPMFSLGSIRPNTTVAVVGQDWRGTAVAKRLGLTTDHLKATPEEAVGYDQIVIAYDYIHGPSYVDTAKPLLERGYRLGETLFIHQMLED